METLGKNPRLVNGSSEQGIGALERFWCMICSSDSRSDGHSQAAAEPLRGLGWGVRYPLTPQFLRTRMQAPGAAQEDLEPKAEEDPWCNTSALCLWRITPGSPGVLESSEVRAAPSSCLRTCFDSEETFPTDSSVPLSRALTSATAQVTSCRQPVARSLDIHRAAWTSPTWDGSRSYGLDSKT